MAKEDLKEIIAEIKQQDIGIAVEKYLSPARKTGFTCTDCGNGTGEDGTGATVYFNDKTNRHELKCHKCGKNLNILEIIAGGENLSLNKYEELLKAIEIACDLYGLHFDSTARSVQAVQDTTTTAEKEVQETAKATAADDKELAMIHDDISIAQKNLPDFIEKQDGKYRGLTYETYNHFGCGFLPQWIHPKTRIKHKQGKLSNPPIPSQRFIISTANHYVAVMLKNDRTPKNKDYWKMHAGSKKEVFGVDLLPLNTKLIKITEGEINAMSIWQATGGKYDVIATGGAADFKSTIQSLQAKFAAIDKKPKIAILFDSDKAGRDNAPRLREELLNRGFPAVCIFLSAEESDIDANDILVNEGDAVLAEKIHNLIDSAQNDFADEIEKLYTQCLIDNETSDVVKSRCNLKPTDLTDSDTSILSVRADKVNERTDFLMGTDTTVTNATKMDLFTLKEAAAYLGVNEKTLRRWNKQKIFAPYLIDHHGDFFYTREEIEQLKEVYTKRRNKTYSNVRDMSAQCPRLT